MQLMTNWQVKKLGDIGRVAMCKRIMKDQTFDVGDIPFYKIGTFGKKPDAFISKDLYESYKLKYSFPKEGDILISASGTIGRAVVYDGEPAYFQDSNIVWLEHDESVVSNNFLAHAYALVNWQTDNGAIARLYNDNFRRVTIKVPEKPEQERIVGVLEVWDEYIEKLEQKIALKEQLKKGLMQQLLTGKRRLPGFSDEWECKPISELFEVKNGYTPSKSNPDFWDGGTIPWFRMEDIRKNGRILKDSIQKITPQAVKGGKLFPANSIIMSTTATIGEHALLIADSLANQQFTFLVRKVNCLEILDPRYVFYQCYPLAEWCKNNVNEGGLTAVDMNGLKKYKLPVPSAEEQKAIVEVLDVSTRNIELLKDELENIQSQKKCLLKNLITGTIRTPEDLQPLDTSRLERSAL